MWVLILYLTMMSEQGGVAVTTIEMKSKAGCELALARAIASAPTGYYSKESLVKGVCVEK